MAAIFYKAAKLNTGYRPALSTLIESEAEASLWPECCDALALQEEVETVSPAADEHKHPLISASGWCYSPVPTSRTLQLRNVCT